MRWIWLLITMGCAGKIDPSGTCAAPVDDAAPVMTTIDAASPPAVQNAAPDSATAPDPNACTTYSDCFDRFGTGSFCFGGTCQSIYCSVENTACPQIAGRECCNLGDGTLACVEGTCCSDAQCAAPESCQNHRCQ